jgi:DNA/RNA endonuclease YhcR with UshA esterase domain
MGIVTFMKETLLVLFVVACAASVIAQALPTYTAQEASKHVGETAVITGEVEDVHQSGKENVILTMAGKYPKQVFTVFIPATTAVKFPHPEQYKGKTIAVSGKISLYHGKPEIIVMSPNQLTPKSP